MLTLADGTFFPLVQPAYAPSPSARAWHSGSSRSGWRARRSKGSGGGNAGRRGTKNSGCASSRDFLPRLPRSIHRRERKRRRIVTGGGPPERWEPAPPSPRAAEAAEEKALGRARKHPPPGGLRKRRRAPQRCRRAPRRHLGARRWRRRPRPQRPPSPRGIGSGASPP
jgi:hypothetical protein